MGGKEMCKNEGANCTIGGKSGKCWTTAGLGCLCKKTTLVVIVGPLKATVLKNSVLVKWETASEIDNVGFFIWRGQLKADKTECSLNAEDYTEVKQISHFILAQGSGTRYSHEDNQVASGNTYCYALEDVDLMDKSTYHLDDISSATVQ